MVLFGRRRRYEVRTGLIWSSVVLKPSHRPVFDCFKYVKTASEQKWTVGRPGNETSLQRMQKKSSSASSFSPRAEFYLKRRLLIRSQTALAFTR